MTAKPESVSASTVAHVSACSPYFATLLARYPAWQQDLLQRPGPKLFPAVETNALDSAAFDSLIRQTRNRLMAGILYRDLQRIDSLEQSLTDLSRLADYCLQATLSFHQHRLEAKFGQPCDSQQQAQPMMIIGLGKLGGMELNFSSDIDILFVYPASGATSGQRKTSNEQYFVQLARAMVASLADTTPDGFVYRVDTRLRPYGNSGPLVQSFSSLEQYYQREGRDWERYAMIKARVAAGDPAAGQRFLDLIKPFVYRRYVDYTAIEELRDMHHRVQAEARLGKLAGNIKRGPGGIRQAEFYVQSFQLLRGGREPGLQTNSFFKAADTIRELGLTDTQELDGVLSGYRYLRTLENRIQALHDRQTHRLPETQTDREALLLAMGQPHWSDLERDIKDHGHRIEQAFLNLFADTAQPASRQAISDWSDKEYSAALAPRIASEPDTALPLLKQFFTSLQRTALSHKAQTRIDQFLPLLFDKLQEQPVATDVLLDILNLLQAIRRRSAYLSMLTENPAALARLIDTVNSSHWVADRLQRFPVLLDEFLTARPDDTEVTRSGLDHSLQRIVAQQDPEQQLMAMNEFRRAQQMRLALAELSEHIGAAEVQDGLTLLAEALINRALAVARAALERRHGQIRGFEFAIIAYGSLGAGSLSYDSDLDLIFLFTAGESLSDGERPISAESFAVRLCQRLLGVLTAQTPAGRLYQVDTRLRPNGRAGLLVSTPQAFHRYQSNDAWTWELQALSRARFIGGDQTLAGAFDQTRNSVLVKPRKENAVRTEIAEMRHKVQRQHAPLSGLDQKLKYAPGGLMDIEFITQLSILTQAHRVPELRWPADINAQLKQLAGQAFMSQQDATTLMASWQSLNQIRNQYLLRRRFVEEDLDFLLQGVRSIYTRLFTQTQ